MLAKSKADDRRQAKWDKDRLRSKIETERAMAPVNRLFNSMLMFGKRPKKFI